MTDTPDIFAPLTDVLIAVPSLAASLEGFASDNDDGITDASAGLTINAAFQLTAEAVHEMVSLERWGAVAGLPLPLPVVPRDVRLHVRAVSRIVCGGRQGRN